MSQAIRRGMVRGGVPSGLSVALALLPKCPLCVAAHVSVVGGAGLGGAGTETGGWMRGMAVAAVLLAVALLGWRAGTRRGYGPLALGCVGAVLVLADVFHVHPGADAHHAAAGHSPWMLWMGVAAMVAASAWNAWPRRGRPVCHATAHC